jgi:hypothetical protein
MTEKDGIVYSACTIDDYLNQIDIHNRKLHTSAYYRLAKNLRHEIDNILFNKDFLKPLLF